MSGPILPALLRIFWPSGAMKYKCSRQSGS